ncbi:MAG: hypothetical protein H6906_15835 [Hyphomicrobiales bacterium]|nr:hypothetical protein [Hyphomicrobiales bacterium]
MLQKRFAGTADLAAVCRANQPLTATAWMLGGLIMIVGYLDALSTNMGLATGLVEEANALMAWMQSVAGDYWLWPKMVMHAGVAAMVVWFPHRLVLAVVTPVVGANALVIYTNLALSGLI